MPGLHNLSVKYSKRWVKKEKELLCIMIFPDAKQSFIKRLRFYVQRQAVTEGISESDESLPLQNSNHVLCDPHPPAKTQHFYELTNYIPIRAKKKNSQLIAVHRLFLIRLTPQQKTTYKSSAVIPHRFKPHSTPRQFLPRPESVSSQLNVLLVDAKHSELPWISRRQITNVTGASSEGLFIQLLFPSNRAIIYLALISFFFKLHTQER